MFQGLNIGKWSTGKHCDGVAVRAFHDRSTKIQLTSWHHRIFYFDEILYTGLSGAPKLILTFPDTWGQRFQSYSLGHFRKVTLQDNLWRPIASKPMHRIHQKCISTWLQWVKEHLCDLLMWSSFFKKIIFKFLMTSYIFHFPAYTPFPPIFFAASWSLTICLETRKKFDGCSFEKKYLYLFFKNITFCQCSITGRLP